MKATLEATSGSSTGPGREGPPETGSESARGLRRARRTRPILAALILLLSGAVLTLDGWLPREVGVGALYCALVVASIWIRSLRFTMLLALLFTLLIALGWHISWQGNPGWMVLANRGVSIALVWAFGAMVTSRLIAFEQFRGVVEASPAGLVVLDRRGRIRFANVEAARALGAAANSLKGVYLERFVDMPWELSSRRKGSRKEEPSRLWWGDALPGTPWSTQARRPTGETFPAEITVRPMRTEIGQVTLLTIRDLTEDLRKHGTDERLATIVRSSPDAIYAVDLEGRVTDWNPGAQSVFGYPSEEILGRSVSTIFPSGSEEHLEMILQNVRAGHSVTCQGALRRTKNGRLIEVDLTASPIRDRTGVVMGASAIARDVTRERQADRLMVELNTALSLAMPGIALVGPDGCLEEVNGNVGRLTGMEDLEGAPWLAVLDPQEHEFAGKAFEEMLRNGRAELSGRAPVAQGRFLEVFLVRRDDPSGRFAGFHLFLRDVTERIRSEEKVRRLAQGLAEANCKLQRLAQVDPLTGLLNRRGLERYVRRLRASTRRSSSPSAVILADIDDFKEVNSEHGHAAGDRILANVAQALQESARPTDVVARIGGDEFLLVLPGTSLAEATLVAERMRSAVSRTCTIDHGNEISVTCSFGVSLLSGQDRTVEQLVEAVRLEFSRSKNDGKDRVCSGTPAPESTLAGIFSGRDLRAVHQPIYDLVENRIVAYEMLTRGPSGRYENPLSFLELARPGEELARLDAACLRACIEAASDLPAGTCVHCNLFPSTLMHLGAEQILRELDHAAPGLLFCIELNEHDIPNSRVLRENVKALRQAGVQIAIDDVGFGGTSLEALVHLEPDVIKIDQSCVRREEDLWHLERLLAVSNSLRARVIVEGVENENVLNHMLALRVRYAQGFLWGRPAPVGARDDDILWPPARQTARRQLKEALVLDVQSA